MCKRFVGLGHAVYVFSTRHRAAFAVVRSQQFVRQLVGCWTTLLFANRDQQPANCQRLLPSPIYLHRNLICSTSDAFGANFDLRLNVLDRRVKNNVGAVA